jgi:hypothetical protein
MKLQNITRTRKVPRTLDGTTNLVDQEYTVQLPRIPADWDARGLKGAASVALAMTAASVAWSTISIGALLHGGIGYAAAGLFDASWIVTILLEWLSRFDPEKRRFAKYMGWGLLALTMGAICWHGLLTGGLALGMVGAAVSLVAKAMWWGVMRHVDKDLSNEDQQWVAAEISKANAKLAIAGVRRQAARAEAAAVADLLAAEMIRTQYTAAAVAMSGEAPQVSATVDPDLSALLAAVRPPSATVPAAEAPQQVTVQPDMQVVRPDAARTPVVPTFLAPQITEPAEAVRPASAPEEEPEEGELVTEDDQARVLVPALYGLSTAEVVRTLMGRGLVDVDLLVDLVPLAVGRQIPADNVKREIRRQKGTFADPVTTAVTSGLTSDGNGPYL